MSSLAASTWGQGGFGRQARRLPGTPVAVAALWLGSAAGLLNLTPGAFYGGDIPNTLATAAARASLAALGLALALRRRLTPGGQGPALWGAALWGLGAGVGGTLVVSALPAFGLWLETLQGRLSGAPPGELPPLLAELALWALLSLGFALVIFVTHFAPSLALSLLVGLAAFPVFSALFEEHDGRASDPPPTSPLRSGLWVGALGLASLWAGPEGPGRWLAWACVGCGELVLFLAHLNARRIRLGLEAAPPPAVRARRAPRPPPPPVAAPLALAAEPFAWELSVSLAPDERRPTPRASGLAVLVASADAERERLVALGRQSALGAVGLAILALAALSAR
ncbi:MAG TPA: hypothetical protein VFS43_31550 [Polyangiaceae bacterium]|nr:hypothetical protein [Polyangiaceae bacterium]